MTFDSQIADRPTDLSGGGAPEFRDDRRNGSEVGPESVSANQPDWSEGGEQPRPWKWPAWFGRVLHSNRTPSILVSLITHSIAILLFAIMAVPRQFGLHSGFSREASLVIGLDNSSDAESAAVELQLATDHDAAPMQSKNTANETTATPSANPSNVANDSSVPIELKSIALIAPLDGTYTSSELANPLASRLEAMNGQDRAVQFAHSSVDGRRAGNRSRLALERGGSLKSEQAVERALEWLAAHQRPSGGWSVWHHHGACDGRCRNPGSPVLPMTEERQIDHHQYSPAATGLALLAFLGAGYTHLDGKYQQAVRRGLYFLRDTMNLDEDPQGGSFLNVAERGMYNQGIATFALCEAYQLTQDPDLKVPCQKAIDFIASAQNYQGGWGYTSKTPGDLTITGWQMMALKSAIAARLDVPPPTVWKLDHFRASQMSGDGINYFYRIPQEHSVNCTAIGILTRLFLGHSWTDPSIMAGLDIISNYPNYHNDIYWLYYTTLTLFHVGGYRWETWNEKCRDYLILKQETQGHEAGSWHFDHHFGNVGGRLYSTAMAALTLEVYYRFSPLYQQVDRPFEL